jgi:hypothetical protein
VSEPLRPLDPIRIEPAAPARRVERSGREPEKEGRGGRQEPPREQREDEAEDDGGLHVDVLV